MNEHCTQGCFGCAVGRVSDAPDTSRLRANTEVLGRSNDYLHTHMLLVCVIMFGIPLLIFACGIYIFHALSGELVSTNATLIISSETAVQQDFVQNLHVAWFVLGLVFASMFGLSRLWPQFESWIFSPQRQDANHSEDPTIKSTQDIVG